MRIRQLEYFIAVAETGSMREAADKLFVAAPSISAQIASLEAELSGALFHRHPRGVSLTQPGRVLLDRAKDVLASLDSARVETRAAITGFGGVLTFGTILSVAAGLLPRALAALSQTNPSVDVVLHEFRSTESLEEAALTGSLDFAIGPEPQVDFPHTLELGNEEMVLVVPPSIATQKPSSVSVTELADERWVTFKKDHGLRVLMESQFLTFGISPRTSVATSQTDVAIQLAAAGLGPTLVPRNVVPQELSGLIRSLDPVQERALFGYARADFSSLTKKFFREVTRGLDCPPPETRSHC